MKRMISVIMVTIVMVMAIGVTSEAKTRDERNDEVAKRINDILYNEIIETEEFEAIEEEYEDDFEVTVIDKRLDTGIYDFTVIISMDEDVAEAHFITDINGVTLKSLEKGDYSFSTDTMEYYKFNGRRVTEEFMDEWTESLVVE